MAGCFAVALSVAALIELSTTMRLMALITGALLGWTIDHYGWGSYFYFMAPFGLIGACLMFFARNRMHPKPVVNMPGVEVAPKPAT